MLSSHLPWTPCDKFVYDFLFIFFLHRWWLWATAYVFTLSMSIVRFLYGPSGAGQGKLYGNRAISVELPCSLRSLQTVIVWRPCRFRAEAARRWCGDGGATVLFLSVRPPRGARVGIVRSHLQHVYGYGIKNFSNFYNFPLNKIVEAAEPVNMYENLTAASCLRKGGYGQDTGSVDPSQAK